MSALDQAFIKAYAKEPPHKPAAASSDTPQAATAAPVRHSADRPGGTRVPASHIENIYAEGTLYRIETPRAADPDPVPPPHYAVRPRRLALRYRLAQLESEEEQVRPAASVRTTLPPAGPSPSHSRGAKAHISNPLAAAEVENEEPQQITVEVGPSLEAKVAIPVAAPTIDAPTTAPLMLSVASSIEVCEQWDELLSNPASLSDSAQIVWPNQEELAAAQASALITLDLRTLPELPEAVTEVVQSPVIPIVPLQEQTSQANADHEKKTRRLDAAHVAVPEPHPPTVEELIKPTEEAKGKVHDRPLAVSEEEAAELVGATKRISEHETTAPKKNSPVSHAPRPLVPAWEVDHFFWPPLCDKLLKDEQSYFSHAGGKIVSAVRDGLKSLAITGSRRGEGRTTLALCLARSAAQAGLKVALIDADFARPQLAASLGIEVAGSWHEAALGKIPLAEAAIKSMAENLTVLPLDVSTAVTPLSLADPRLTKTLREAAETFDLLVLDLGPLTTGGESLFPENEPPPADAAIVVRDLRYCTPAESQAIGERLSRSGIEAVGIAENFVPAERLVA